VKVLIDTHVLLWWLTDDPRLTPAADALLRDPATDVYVSVASLWEIGIKHASGRLPLSKPPGAFLPDVLAACRFEILPIRAPHAYAAAALPPHHKDPFDRMLIAQSLVEGLPVITDDPWFRPYGVEIAG
jgi:PIN domain nuclease of toxin-antitoxin system